MYSLAPTFTLLDAAFPGSTAAAERDGFTFDADAEGGGAIAGCGDGVAPPLVAPTLANFTAAKALFGAALPVGFSGGGALDWEKGDATVAFLQRTFDEAGAANAMFDAVGAADIAGLADGAVCLHPGDATTGCQDTSPNAVLGVGPGTTYADDSGSWYEQVARVALVRTREGNWFKIGSRAQISSPEAMFVQQLFPGLVKRAVVMFGDAVDLETSETALVRDFGGPAGLMGGSGSGDGACPVIAQGQNCDQWFSSNPGKGLTCKYLEAEGFDCRGCIARNIASSPLFSYLPPPSPHHSIMLRSLEYSHTSSSLHHLIFSRPVRGRRVPGGHARRQELRRPA